MGDLFPLLLRLAHDECIRHRILTMSPEKLDNLGQEIALVFQRCSKNPESDEHNDDGRASFNEGMMDSTVAVLYLCFSEQAEIDTKTGRDDITVFNQLQKTFITPANLQSLFRMCDPNSRSGCIRCQALFLLNVIGGITSTYHLSIPSAGANGDASFGQIQILTMANALTQENFCEFPRGFCNCAIAPWEALYEALVTSVDSKETNDVTLLESIGSIDWPFILQQKNVHIVKDPRGNIYYDSLIFVCLHRLVCKVLANESENIMAKTFLREKLGACHKLLHTVLRRIISGEIFASEASSHGISRLDEIEMQVGAFLGRFMNCLVPALLVDHETMSLVRQARLVLMEPIVQAMCPTQNHLHLPKNTNKRRQVFCLQKILSAMDQWSRLLLDQSSDQACWKRFQEAFLIEKASSLTAIKSQVVENHWNEKKSRPPSRVTEQEEKRDHVKKTHKKRCLMVLDTSPPPLPQRSPSFHPKNIAPSSFKESRDDHLPALHADKCVFSQHKKSIILLALLCLVIVLLIGSFRIADSFCVAQWCAMSLTYHFPIAPRFPPGNATTTTATTTGTECPPQLQVI